VAFAGGSADKIGSEYETWWTLRRVTQLLRGEIDAIAIEPLGADGAEHWVEARGMRTYDQVKYRSSARWTPSKLRSDGLLAKLGRHYAAGWRVLLILSQPSEELEQLIDLAKATSSGEELWDAATDANDLNLIADAWGVGKDETRSYLLQTTVRHDGLPHLKEFVDLALETLVLGITDTTIGVLRRFLEERINTTFTAPDVWAALNAAGLAARPRVESGPTISMLREALDRHLRTTRSSIPTAGTINRHEVADIVEAIANSNSPILLIAGKAGVGKSMVVADAAERLAASGRHVTALRLDRMSPSTSTAAQLGMSVGLDGSPVVLLSEVSPNGYDGILVIDQLDAVSNYSGRMPSVYEAVDDALTQARLLGNVRVILAVRSIDLEEDPRLRKLAGENVPTITVGELNADDIQTYLTQLGTNVAMLDASTIELLRLPIHLYVFSELEPSMRSVSYGTLASLYSAFTRSFRNRLDVQGYSDEWPEVSRVLVERMNADEALAVPVAALEHIRPLYLGALLSANVLIEQDGRLALFHETYFDYLFAKSFAPRGPALVDWFAATGQGLFRRSQLRQLLAYIATEDRGRFIEQIMTIANSSLRPHLVSIAYTVLGGFDPSPADWSAVRRLLRTNNSFSTRVISLIGGPKWFTAADATGDIDVLLDSAEWSEVSSGLVAGLSADLPDRVLELLRPRQSQGHLWIRALRSAIEIADSPAWADFALGQIVTGDLDLPDQPFDILETALFHRLIGPHPIDALRLLALTLTRDVDRAIAEQVSSLDDVLSRRGRRSIDVGEIEQLATASGPQFVEVLLPLIEKIATYNPSEGVPTWRFRTTGTNRDFDDEVYFSFDEALTQLARDDAAGTIPILERLTRHHSNSLDFLVCRAMNEVTADRAIDWVLEAEEHRAVGWISDIRWESRRLIEHASQNCSDDRFAALETTILYWNPEHPNATGKLQRWGWAELHLLSALATERLSPAASRRLAELHRKFPDWGPAEPQGMTGGFVQSPISRAAADRMTDAHWLRAITKYQTREHPTFRGDGAFGGSDELASTLGTLAKVDPTRFLHFALALPSTTPPTYTEHLIRNLSGEVDQLELIPLLRKFRADHPTKSGRATVSAINEYAQEITDELFNELLLLAEDGDPTREFAREKANSGYYFGGDFVTAGINSTRGQVASTLARVIFADNSRLEASLPILKRLADDPIVAVRTLATEPALAYASIARENGLSLLASLLDNDLVLTTSSALQGLRWAMLWEADRFAPFLTRALASEDARQAGAHWANCAVNGALGSAPTEVVSLSESARLGVADAITSNPGLAPSLVAALFDDPSAQVRREISRSLHFLKEMEVDEMSNLIEHFLESAAFSDASPDLLDALEDLPGELPAIAWEACRRVVDSIEASTPKRFGQLTGDLIAVLARLYRSTDDAGREAALDLIDRTVILQLWRVDQILDDAR
jgi:hypothetical protein